MNVIRHDIDMASSVAVSGVGEAFRPERKWPISYDSVELITVVADACMILAASIFAGVIYHYRAFGTPGDIIQYLGSATVVAALFISLMKSRGMYRPKELLVLRTQIRTICLLWVAVFFLLAGTVFALKVGTELSRGTCLLFAVIGLSTLIVHRILWRSLLAKGVIRRRFSGRRVVLITDHRQSAERGPSRRPDKPGFSFGTPLRAATA